MRRKSCGKFFRLSNGQYMKIQFSYKSLLNAWFMSICVANTKRQCNDCMNKTENSPKVMYGKVTGRRLGAEPFLIAKNELMELEKLVSDTEIRIVGTSERLNKVYRYLKKYGYEEKETKTKDGRTKIVLCKEIN